MNTFHCSKLIVANVGNCMEFLLS